MAGFTHSPFGVPGVIRQTTFFAAGGALLRTCMETPPPERLPKASRRHGNGDNPTATASLRTPDALGRG